MKHICTFIFLFTILPGNDGQQKEIPRDATFIFNQIHTQNGRRTAHYFDAPLQNITIRFSAYGYSQFGLDE